VGGCGVPEADDLEFLSNEAGRLFAAGDYRLAHAAYSRLITEAYAAGAVHAELNARCCACMAELNLGEFERAIDTATRLLARAREAENDEYKVWASLSLGIALADFSVRERWPEVETVLTDGLQRAREIHDNYLETYHLARLGIFATMAGEHDKAMAWIQQGLDSVTTLTPDTERAWFRGDFYQSLARLMLAKGDLGEARRYAAISLAEYQRYGRAVFVNGAQVTLALIEYKEGCYEQACELLDTALESIQASGMAATEQETQYIRSMALRAHGDLAASLAAAQRSLELARKMRMKADETKVLISLGETLRMLGSGEAATEALSLARGIAEERGYQDCLDELELLGGAL
jgi:tetratricopeptide (TPR) repeat protein